MKVETKVNITMVVIYTAIAYALVASFHGTNPLTWHRKTWIAFIAIDLICSLYYLYAFRNRPL